MSWNMVRLQDIQPSPWRNSGGVTRELVAWPNAIDWQWRMSVAEVASSGPFSTFAGVTRWFAVLSGAGVCLKLAGDTHRLTQDSAPFCFDGAAAVACDLINGTTQDFNLMLRDNAAGARMERVRNRFVTSTITPKFIAAYAISTWATVHFDDEVLQLPPDCLAWSICPADTALSVRSENALYMEITP